MIATTEKMQKKSLARPDETRTFDKGRVEMITMGGVTFGRATFEPGWRWSTCVKPVVNPNSCQNAHLGFQISGRMHVQMDDGTTLEIGPGEVCSIPPGHDGWVVGNEPVVVIDITGMGDYAKRK